VGIPSVENAQPAQRASCQYALVSNVRSTRNAVGEDKKQTRIGVSWGLMTRRTTSSRKPRPGTAGPRSGGRLQRAIDATARREIEAALRETEGNVTHAARALGVTRVALIKRIRSLGIEAAKFRP
jgi:transcriptional regulator with GAF, ATPase, and Fis domain